MAGRDGWMRFCAMSGTQRRPAAPVAIITILRKNRITCSTTGGQKAAPEPCQSSNSSWNAGAIHRGHPAPGSGSCYPPKSTVVGPTGIPSSGRSAPWRASHFPLEYDMVIVERIDSAHQQQRHRWPPPDARLRASWPDRPQLSFAVSQWSELTGNDPTDGKGQCWRPIHGPATTPLWARPLRA
jgi:hypothetical protein